MRRLLEELYSQRACGQLGEALQVGAEAGHLQGNQRHLN